MTGGAIPLPLPALLNRAPLEAGFWLKGSPGMAEDAPGLFSGGVSSPGPSPPAGCPVVRGAPAGSIPGPRGAAGGGHFLRRSPRRTGCPAGLLRLHLSPSRLSPSVTIFLWR